jgi:hypothetical protein
MWNGNLASDTPSESVGCVEFPSHSFGTKSHLVPPPTTVIVNAAKGSHNVQRMPEIMAKIASRN